MGPLELFFLFVAVGVPLLAVVSVLRGTRKSRPESFAEAHGFELTSGNRAMVESYLRRSVKWRIGGAIVGAVVPFGIEVPGVEMITGYLVGALIAELGDNRTRAQSGAAAASLIPRRLDDYLSPRVLIALRTLAVAGLGIAALYFTLPERNLSNLEVTAMPFVVTAAGITVVAVGVELALRAIVRRRQPAAAHDLVAADDGIRAASIHATAGAGIAVILLLIATECFVVGRVSDIPQMRWAMSVAAILALVAAFATWARFGHDIKWRVQRSANVLGAAS